MQITVEYAAQLKRAAGLRSEHLELEADCTVRELVVRLSDRHGEALQGLLVDAAGLPQRSLLVFVGERQFPSDSDTLLSDRDVVTILTPISGG